MFTPLNYLSLHWTVFGCFTFKDATYNYVVDLNKPEIDLSMKNY